MLDFSALSELPNDSLVLRRPRFSMESYSKYTTIFNRKYHQIATCATPNCGWEALERRKIKKNSPDFFLRKSEDPIRSKMKRSRRHDKIPCAQTKKPFFHKKNVFQNELPRAAVDLKLTFTYRTPIFVEISDRWHHGKNTGSCIGPL